MSIKQIIGAVGALFQEAFQCFVLVANSTQTVEFLFVRKGYQQDHFDVPYTFMPLSSANWLRKKAKRAFPTFFQHPDGTELWYHVKRQDGSVAEYPDRLFRKLCIDGILAAGKDTHPIIIEITERLTMP